MFSRNESAFDRGLRVVLGLVLLSLVFVGPKSLWGLLGLIPLLTGAIGWCPLYRVLGLHTNHAPPKPGSGLA
jgi:hypothetical protein